MPICRQTDGACYLASDAYSEKLASFISRKVGQDQITSFPQFAGPFTKNPLEIFQRSFFIQALRSNIWCIGRMQCIRYVDGDVVSQCMAVLLKDTSTDPERNLRIEWCSRCHGIDIAVCLTQTPFPRQALSWNHALHSVKNRCPVIDTLVFIQNFNGSSRLCFSYRRANVMHQLQARSSVGRAKVSNSIRRLFSQPLFSSLDQTFLHGRYHISRHSVKDGTAFRRVAIYAFPHSQTVRVSGRPLPSPPPWSTSRVSERQYARRALFLPALARWPCCRGSSGLFCLGSDSYSLLSWVLFWRGGCAKLRGGRARRGTTTSTPTA